MGNYGVNPIQAWVRSLTPIRYTLKEAAQMVGRSEDTLLRWEREHGVKIASEDMPFGQLTVRLFTPEDIDHLRDIARSGKLPPKKKAQK